MRWRVLLLVVVGAAGYLAADAATRDAPLRSHSRASPAWFTLKGKVTRVVDGDTLIARIGRRSERVRLIGIDSPEVGQCYAAQATTMARKLALNRRVTLQGDRTQTRRDRYGRLLAYVRLPGKGIRDLGLLLMRAGRARVYVFNRPFARLPSYRAAEVAAIAGRLGLWGACVTAPTTSTATTSTAATTTTTGPSTTTTTGSSTSTTSPTSSTTTTTPPTNCAPSYPDVCIPPPPPDLDCSQIPYRNFRVIYTVPQPDPHRFDGDHDGIGCET
jgi:micrococcal nuclease